MLLNKSEENNKHEGFDLKKKKKKKKNYRKRNSFAAGTEKK